MMENIKARDPSMSLLSQDQLADLNSSLNALFSQSNVMQSPPPSTSAMQQCYSSPINTTYSRGEQNISCLL